MSDSKPPKPLPDDFGETTPNIKVPKSDSPSYKEQPSSSDWEKTNYNYSPKDLGQQQDDWNKTSYNTPKAPKNNPPPDFNNTYSPQQPRGKQDDWSMTEANINIPFNQSNPHDNRGEEDFSSRGQQQHHGKTTPFIYLPESEKEKVKFQEHKPQTKVEEQKEGAQKKGGIPGWLWTVGGLFVMFLFAVTVILAVYVFFMGRTGFEVVLKGAKPQTDVLVDGSFWGVSSSDGTIRLPVLRAGKRTFTFVNASFKCDAITVTGADGDPPHEESMRCSGGAPPPVQGGFEVIIVNAPPKSEVWVDNKNAGTTDDKGTAKLQVEEGPRKIEVKNPGLKCKIQDISGIKGDKKELSASCRPPEIPDVCFNLKKGQYDLAADCAFKELARLEKLDKEGTPYTVDQVLLAMNLYIINFDSGKFVIKKPRDFEFIKRASEFILKLPGSTVIEVGGHTDNVGKDVKNIPLSENRAKAVKTELVKLGIKEPTLPIKGYGPKQPIEDNTTEDGRWRNRRIQYTVVSK